MKKPIYLFASLFVCLLASAQSPVDTGLHSINRSTAEAYTGFLASDELLGREAGMRENAIAANYIVANLKSIGILPYVGDSYYQPFTSPNRKFTKPDTLSIQSDPHTVMQRIQPKEVSMKNVLAMIPGTIADEYVIVGAHYDHLGFNPELVGDQIFNGADDNASGVSAVLQIARAFKENGVTPRRNVIFAFWDGEEKGLLGSRFFVDNFADLSQVKCYMNFDMIGRNTDEGNPNHVVYFFTDTHPQYGQWLQEDTGKYGFALKPDYRAWDKPVTGSDNASFARRGIPVIWYHTDGHPDYHKPGDHAEKLNWDKLVEITQTAYLVLWRVANENAE